MATRRSQGGGARLLVVDDDPGVRRLLQDALVVHEFEVETADSGTEAVEQASTVKPDLVLLDLGLPDVYGLELLEHLREMAAAPIMVLSAHHDEGTKVAALELGAQDYVTKPFGLAELVARIRVRLRLRAGAGHGDAIFRVKDLAVDLQRRRVHVAGREARLTAKEFDLLKALIHADGQVLTVQQPLHQVWGVGYACEAGHVRVYIERLRKKLGDNGQDPRYIGNQRGMGYYLVTDA